MSVVCRDVSWLWCAVRAVCRRGLLERWSAEDVCEDLEAVGKLLVLRCISKCTGDSQARGPIQHEDHQEEDELPTKPVKRTW